MAFYNVKIKCSPEANKQTGVRYKPKTYTGLLFGDKKMTVAQIGEKAKDYIKTHLEDQHADLKISYSIVEVKRIREDFMICFDKQLS